MNKDLINLQKGGRATAVIILEDDLKQLNNAVVIKAGISNDSLFEKIIQPAFIDKLNVLSKSADIMYFVISKVDEITEDEQQKYTGLVKDRILVDLNLPQNCIIVLTVTAVENIKKISSELYHFCAVAI